MKILFWLLWPGIYLLSRGSKRTRVLLLHEGDILLVKNRLSSNDKWSLPGGGIKKGELAAQAACRELREEVGVSLQPADLRSIGSVQTTISHIPMHMEYFVAELADKPAIKLQKLELTQASWLTRSSLQPDDIQLATRAGLKLL